MRQYEWNDVEDFGVRVIRSGILVTNRMITFSRKDKKKTLLGKASRLLAGGTEVMPAIGNFKKLMMVMQSLHRQAHEELPESDSDIPEDYDQEETEPAEREFMPAR